MRTKARCALRAGCGPTAGDAAADRIAQRGTWLARAGRARAWAGSAGSHALRAAALAALLAGASAFTMGGRAGLRLRAAPQVHRGIGPVRAGAPPPRRAVAMQAERGLSDEAAFAVAAAGLRPRADGGPFVDTDVPSFLRLVRTGERWFELQTAVVTYASPQDSQACALPQLGRAAQAGCPRARPPRPVTVPSSRLRLAIWIRPVLWGGSSTLTDLWALAAARAAGSGFGCYGAPRRSPLLRAS